MEGLRVYCAGPLFNQKEQEEMADIANALEEAGFSTFLPQRDGLELTKCVEHLVSLGLSATEANSLMAEAIFALDVYQVLEECDILVANLNGRVPDEGTVSEAAMAWARGKPVVGYKSDSRTVLEGADNPLVTGLFSFRLAKSSAELVSEVRGRASETEHQDPAVSREEEITESLRLGEEIWRALSRTKQVDDVIDTIRRFRSAGMEIGQ